MTLSADEMLRSNHASDLDGRTIVVGPDGDPIAAGSSNTEGTPGSAPPAKATVIAGSDGTNVRRIATDANGIVKIDVAGQDVTLTVQQARPSTATLTNVASSASNVTLLSATAGRMGATIFNDSTQVLYVKFGTTASSSSYTVQIAAGGYYEVPTPVYTGRIDGIWAAANGNARITELTA